MTKWFLYLISCLILTLTFIIVGTKNFYAETNTVSSTVVNNTPPTANAPVLPNSNSDICKVVWTSMMDAGTPCPVNGLIGAEAAAYWEANPDKIPDGSRYKPEYIAANKPEKGEFSDAQNVALFKTLFIFTTGLLLF